MSENKNLDFKQINKNLLTSQVYKQWFPNGIVTGSTYRAPNHVRGGKNNNLWIVLTGNGAGSWGDFTINGNEAIGNMLVSLYAYMNHMQGWDSKDPKVWGKCMYACLDRLGMQNRPYSEPNNASVGENQKSILPPLESQNKASNAHEKDKPYNAAFENGKKFYNRAISVIRTSGMDYLKKRGLVFENDPSPLQYVRFTRELDYWHDKKPIGEYPALLIPFFKYPYQEATAFHIIYLDHNCKSKAFHKESKYPSKKSMGSYKGAAMHLPGIHEPEVIAIGEGIETVLSWQQLNFAETGKLITCWAAGGKDNFKSLQVPKDKVIWIITDNDKDSFSHSSGQHAAKEFKKRLGALGIEVQGFLYPSNKPNGYDKWDWNDQLLFKMSPNSFEKHLPANKDIPIETRDISYEKLSQMTWQELKPYLGSDITAFENLLMYKLGDHNLMAFKRSRVTLMDFEELRNNNRAFDENGRLLPNQSQPYY